MRLVALPIANTFAKRRNAGRAGIKKMTNKPPRTCYICGRTKPEADMLPVGKGRWAHEKHNGVWEEYKAMAKEVIDDPKWWKKPEEE